MTERMLLNAFWQRIMIWCYGSESARHGWDGDLKELRQMNEETKVLILSARGQITDKVEGLDAGANDYMENHSTCRNLRHVSEV